MRDDWRTDIENAPKDGSDVLFPIEFVGRAFWDAEMRRWVLAYPIHLDFVAAPRRFQLPKAQRADLPPHEGDAVERSPRAMPLQQRALTREQITAVVIDEIGNIEVDRHGSCRWPDVANAGTHITAQLCALLAEQGTKK